MTTETIIGSVVALLGGAVLAYWWRARSAASTKATLIAGEAKVLAEDLARSREKFIRGADVTLKEVTDLEHKLNDKKRELAELRGAPKGRINALLEELEGGR